MTRIGRPDMHWVEIDGNAVPAHVAGIETYEQLAEWEMRDLEEGRRRVQSDDVGRFQVSTIFLGRNMQMTLLFPDRPPLLYESALFEYPADGSDRRQRGEYWRYSTREAALEGHGKLVKALQAGVDPVAALSMEYEP